MTQSPTLARSYLYVPGDRPELLAGARVRGADALIADLEDAVGPSHKQAARDHVAAWLRDAAAAERGEGDEHSERSGSGVNPPQYWVRVNAETIPADLDAVVTVALHGVFVSKSEPELLGFVDELLSKLETERGLPAGQIAVAPMVETGAALQQLPAIATAPRVLRLGMGEADLAADLGLSLDDERSTLTPLRLQVVIASAAAHIARPVGATSTAFRDLEAFRRSGEVLRRLGFRGRTAIHPGQIAVIHEVFTPNADEVAAARDMIARFDAAEGGGAVDANGRFIDLAVIRNAREVLALAGE